MITEVPILIIGGGPAGLSTALHLTQIAPHLADLILLLEKADYPRQKLCAGGLTVDAEILLERLGLDVREIPHANAPAMHFHFEGKGLKISFTNRHSLRIIRRDEFDAWLVEKAASRGIEIRENTTVKDVQPGNEAVTVITNQGEFRAQVVIAADGSIGITHRRVLPNEPVYRARVLEVITPVEPPVLPYSQAGTPKNGNIHGNLNTTRTNPEHNDRPAYFDFFPVPNNISGYVWDFPTQVKGQPMRCWGIFDANLLGSSNRPQLSELLRQEMARHGFDLDDYRLQGYPIRWFEPTNMFSLSRVLFVGDAAGTDPFFGEGISTALGYGLLAAKEVDRAFKNNDFSFQRYRHRLIWSSLGISLFSRWLITNVIYPLKWRWFQFLLWRLLKPVVYIVAWLFILNWGKRLR